MWIGLGVGFECVCVWWREITVGSLGSVKAAINKTKALKGNRF